LVVDIKRFYKNVSIAKADGNVNFYQHTHVYTYGTYCVLNATTDLCDV